MAYLEELLPEFRKGAKIRQNDWPDGVYIFVRNGEILPSHPSLDVKDDNGLISNKWEFYQEPIVDEFDDFETLYEELQNLRSLLKECDGCVRSLRARGVSDCNGSNLNDLLTRITTAIGESED